MNAVRHYLRTYRDPIHEREVEFANGSWMIVGAAEEDPGVDWDCLGVEDVLDSEVEDTDDEPTAS